MPLLKFKTTLPGVTKESYVISEIVLDPDTVYYTSNTKAIELIVPGEG